MGKGKGRCRCRRGQFGEYPQKTSIIAIFLAFSLWLNNMQPVEMSDIESAFNNLCEEDRTYMLEIYSSDIFMN